MPLFMCEPSSVPVDPSLQLWARTDRLEHLGRGKIRLLLVGPSSDPSD